MCFRRYHLSNRGGDTFASSLHSVDALSRDQLELSRLAFRALVCLAHTLQCMETSLTTPSRHRAIPHRRNHYSRSRCYSPDFDRCCPWRPKSRRSVSRCVLPPRCLHTLQDRRTRSPRLCTPVLWDRHTIRHYNCESVCHCIDISPNRPTCFPLKWGR